MAIEKQRPARSNFDAIVDVARRDTPVTPQQRFDEMLKRGNLKVLLDDAIPLGRELGPEQHKRAIMRTFEELLKLAYMDEADKFAEANKIPVEEQRRIAAEICERYFTTEIKDKIDIKDDGKIIKEAPTLEVRIALKYGLEQLAQRLQSEVVTYTKVQGHGRPIRYPVSTKKPSREQLLNEAAIKLGEIVMLRSVEMKIPPSTIAFRAGTNQGDVRLLQKGGARHVSLETAIKVLVALRFNADEITTLLTPVYEELQAPPAAQNGDQADTHGKAE